MSQQEEGPALTNGLPDFRDCLGRPIQVGDVLCCGQRRRSHGGIALGIVTGFTQKTILVDMLNGGWKWDHREPITSWELRKGHFSAPYNCVVTTMTREQLLATAGLPGATREELGKE